MPRDNRPGSYNHNRNSSINSETSGSINNTTKNNQSGYYRNNSHTRNTNYSSGSSNARNYDSNQPSTSRQYSSIANNRIRKLFVNQNSNNNTKEYVLTTSLRSWKSRNFVNNRSNDVQCTISSPSTTYCKMIEIQRKFPLWSTEYRTNVCQVSIRMFYNEFLFFRRN